MLRSGEVEGLAGVEMVYEARIEPRCMMRRQTHATEELVDILFLYQTVFGMCRGVAMDLPLLEDLLLVIDETVGLSPCAILVVGG